MSRPIHPPNTRAPNLPPEVVAALDPGIRRTVIWLRMCGLDTSDSGDGKTKQAWIAEGEAMTYPHVLGPVQPDALVREARSLVNALRDVGLVAEQLGPDPGEAIHVHAFFDAGGELAILELDGVDDARLLATPAWCERYGDAVQALLGAVDIWGDTPPEDCDAPESHPEGCTCVRPEGQ